MNWKFLFTVFLVVTGCWMVIDEVKSSISMEQKIAQKIMLDLRYYCPEMREETDNAKQQGCRTPLTKLPDELAELITDTSLGSVILFSENLVGIEQIITLTNDLQMAAQKSPVGQPLFISVDQEGGRVARLPRDIATSFTGNMSIGATYPTHGIKLSKQVGQVIGRELKALGININHAPNVDVNINPNNPVINVRAFSEDPFVVADLGIAMLEGFQSQGVMGTLKHFPGHGDTNTDSHTGLPIVDHDIETIKQFDLFPFQQAIARSDVKMIMTAHIQYPALDNSTVINKFGQQMIKPATISKTILTDVLRGQLGYQGLIITDALDMAGIANFFTPVEAVLHTFSAGADIAMMPMKIRTKDDITEFKKMLATLALRVKEEQAMQANIEQSLNRILTVKKNWLSKVNSSLTVTEKIARANEILANSKHRLIERQLAELGVVTVHKKSAIEQQLKNAENIHLIMPKAQQYLALSSYLSNKFMMLGLPEKNITSSTLKQFSKNQALYQNSDVIVIATEELSSVVDMGGAEDLTSSVHQNETSDLDITKILQDAKLQGRGTIFISLKLPTTSRAIIANSDWLLTTFDGSTYLDNKTEQIKSPALEALTEILLGQFGSNDYLPMQVIDG